MTATKQPSRHPKTLTRARLVVRLDARRGSWDGDQVENPGRVLRMYALLQALNEELHKVTLPPQALPGLQRRLDAVRGELEQSVSGTLACGNASASPIWPHANMATVSPSHWRACTSSIRWTACRCHSHSRGLACRWLSMPDAASRSSSSARAGRPRSSGKPAGTRIHIDRIHGPPARIVSSLSTSVSRIISPPAFPFTLAASLTATGPVPDVLGRRDRSGGGSRPGRWRRSGPPRYGSPTMIAGYRWAVAGPEANFGQDHGPLRSDRETPEMTAGQAGPAGPAGQGGPAAAGGEPPVGPGPSSLHSPADR